MADIQTALDWRGRDVVDSDGERIGTLRDIFLDADDQPAWASVHTGLFGLRQSLVPLGHARARGEDVEVPFTRDHVKDAPGVDPDVQLEPDEEDRLYRHYGLAAGTDDDDSDPAVPAEATDVDASDRPAMTRSEEELRVVGKERRVRGRARLRRWVETEVVNVEVPVRKEKAKVEYEPAPGADPDERPVRDPAEES